MRTRIIKYFITLSALFFGAVLGYAQGNVYTVRARLSDFYSCTTKVVLSDNEMVDAILTDAVSIGWRISPYEFCSSVEYEQIKGDASFYFLRIVYKDSEPGLAFLSLEKGGKAGRGSSFDSAFIVVMIPIDKSDFSTGRCPTYLPAFINIVQTYVEDAMIQEGRSLVGLTMYNKHLLSNEYTRAIVAENDIDPRTSVPGYIELMDIAETDTAFEQGGHYLVGLTICPEFPQRGAKSYQFILTADTHEIYFYHVRKYDNYDSCGLTAKDISLLSKSMKYANR